ncbi:FeoC-like transcriptional regulator [Enterovibrio norvegicus]|uniref:FeoC-like transcriptional regulator n=1 Tax=Enterovibrio norvegicus TaxID=188144 RepID=UPI0013D01F40|nr:FeoC-like transcriptional regulator [Enterovibrio norvegicus]
MILTDLKLYIEAHPKCSQAELAKVFNLSEDGVDAMLSVWVKKGRVKTIVSARQGKSERRYIWLANDEFGITVIQ